MAPATLLLVYQIKDAAGQPCHLRLRGLDPNGRYRVREINLPENTPSALELDGQTVDGATLMRNGLTPPTRKQLGSAVIEITEVP